ncbi:beta-glucosidase BglX [Oenococcus alcoholitolerans]|uniref:beta-glucosidase BglX n=1 Tax=Oenococcus alcoholitolerans TaxID=931074 RepID=UPI003F6F488D
MLDNFIDNLLKQMTLDEKIGQLQQVTGDFFGSSGGAITGPIDDQAKKYIKDNVYNIGSVLGISGKKEIIDIQKNFLQHSRLKIPLLFMADIIHGYKTIFPIPLGLAASWDPKLIKDVAQASADEAAAEGISVTFSPMADLVRDPRWGRVMESTGEDPFLNSIYAKAFVEGYQGKDRIDNNHLAATVKHFAGYGAVEAGREYNTVDMSEWRFRSEYLPSYKAAVEAKAQLVMTSFNTLFGIPVTGNRYILQDILRKELSFDGVIISDWNSIGELIDHGVAENMGQAASLALKAGVDIDMMSFSYISQLENLIDSKKINIDLIDHAVYRILSLKKKLGLFDDPFRGLETKKVNSHVFTDEKLALAQKAAEESIVLLKNDDKTLPLNIDDSVALVGDIGDSHDLLGSWSFKGDKLSVKTIKESLYSKFKKIVFAKGYKTASDFSSKMAEEAVAIAKKQKYIIFVAGLESEQSGEASSLTDIKIADNQIRLLKKLAELGKPIITLLVTGRPLDLTEIQKYSNAILLAWFPGTKGADALAKIITGETNPSGKITMTFPRNVGQTPIYYNHFNTGRPLLDKNADEKYLSKYLDSPNDPLYPFGFGLSYSNFKIGQLTVDSKEIKENSSILASIIVHNPSKLDGDATVQWYIRDLSAEVVRPVKELKFFEKKLVKAGSSSKFIFRIDLSDLSYVHSNKKMYPDKGKFILAAGFSSSDDDLSCVEFIYK